MKYSMKIESINGFSHKIGNSLMQTDAIQQSGVILPLKNSLRFVNGIKSKEIIQTQRDISAIAMTGPFMAIGVRGFLGQLITTYFFNIYQIEDVKKLCYQKTKIQQLAISKNGKYLCSLGNSDDKTYTYTLLSQDFVIIDTEQDFSIATQIYFRKTVKGKQKIVDVVFSTNNSLFFALLYKDKLCFVKIIEETEQVEQILIKSNRVRQFKKVVFNDFDTLCYTASKNGDIAQFDVANGKQMRVGPKKRIIISGIKFIKKIGSEHMLIVGLKGFIAVVQIQDLKIIKEVTLNEQIISVSDFIDGIAFVSTQKAIIYKLYCDTLEAKPFYVCVREKINQIAYCDASVDIVATCSSNQIILWDVKGLKPQLRIAIPKVTCNSICIQKYGKFIVSAWGDGSIRLFHAYNGKLMIKIQNCHPGPINKIIIDYNQTKIISGGQKGEIKVWYLDQKKLGLAMGAMSHHTKRVNQLKINPSKFEQMVCCSEDGSYSIWNLQSLDLIYCYKVCNFLKDCYFQDSFTISFVGSGSHIYRVIKPNGMLVQKIQINNSHINCMYNFENVLQNNIIIYGGQSQYLYLMNHTLKLWPHLQQKVYSQVTAFKLLPDNQTIIVGTVDGIIIRIQLKQTLVQYQIEKEDDKYYKFKT